MSLGHRPLPAAAACLLAVLACAPPMATATEAGDEADLHRARGTTLYLSEQYEDALREFRAAYAARQSPDLLVEIARSYRKLGRAQSAIQYYQRFLTASPDAPEAKHQEVQAAIAQLRALASEEPAAPASPPAGLTGLPDDVRLMPMRLEMRRNGGLIVGGVVVLTAAYAAALLAGTIGVVGESDYTSDSGNKKVASGLLLLPVVGPFLSGIAYHDVNWAAPWIIVDGLAQAAGLAMIVAGAVRVTPVAVPYLGEVSSLRLAPFATPHGGGLAVSASF